MALNTVTVNNCNYCDSIITVSPSGSPFTWTQPENCPVEVLVSGGTVTSISKAPSLLGLVNLGILGGLFRMNPGEQLMISYILPPTMKYWSV